MILLGFHVIVFQKRALQRRPVSTPERMGLAYERLGGLLGFAKSEKTDGHKEIAVPQR